MKKKNRIPDTSGQYHDFRVSFFLIAPFLTIFFLFTVVPVLLSALLGFTSFNMLEFPRFIGLENFTRMFLEDTEFVKALRNTLVMALVIGPGGYLLSLLFAWFMNELAPRVRAVITFLFYVPSISGNVYLMWSVMFSSDRYGYINGFLMKFGLISSPIQWLKDPRYMMGIVILVALWGSLGTSFLSFIAGFQGLDRRYYEAGALDGISNRWQELWHITLPLLRPQMMFGAVMSISSSFGVGAIGTALCGMPSTDYAVHTLMNMLEDYGGQRFEMGYACAIATLLFLMMVGANFLIQRVLEKVGE